MEQTNPAVQQQTLISPALLEEIETNPKAIATLSKKMLLVQVDAVHRRMRDPNTPVGQRLQFIDIRAKLGDAYPKAAAVAVAPGAGFSVNIIMAPNEPKKIPTKAVEIIENEPATATAE